MLCKHMLIVVVTEGRGVLCVEREQQGGVFISQEVHGGDCFLAL